MGGIREKGRGIGKSVWMKILRIEGRRVGKGSVTVGVRKREGKRCRENLRKNLRKGDKMSGIASVQDVDGLGNNAVGRTTE